jgi:hypothetical protein
MTPETDVTVKLHKRHNCMQKMGFNYFSLLASADTANLLKGEYDAKANSGK